MPKYKFPQELYFGFFKSTDFPEKSFTWVHEVGNKKIAEYWKTALKDNDLDTSKIAEPFGKIKFGNDEYTCLGHVMNQDNLLEVLRGGKVPAAGSCANCPYVLRL